MVLQCTAGGTNFAAYLDFYVFIFPNGNHDQQQSVPRLWCANDKPRSVHEVLPLQSRWAGGVEIGAVAPGLQAAA